MTVVSALCLMCRKCPSVTTKTFNQGKLRIAFTKFSESMANDTAQDTKPQGSYVRLVGFLLSIPCISLLNLATSPMVLSSNGMSLSILAIAFAVPMILLALLSLFNGESARRIVTVALAPTAFLLISQGHLNTLAVSLLIVAILAREANARRFDRTLLAISSVLTLTVTSILIAMAGDIAAQITSVLSFAPAILAGLVYVGSDRSAHGVSEAAYSPSAFEISSLMAQETGVVVLALDRSARVSAVSPNAFDVLQRKQSELTETGLLDCVHLADKVILLSEVDAVSNGRTRGRFKIRMHVLTPLKGAGKKWADLSCTALNVAGEIMLIIEPVKQPVSKPDEREGQIGMSTLAIVSHELRTPLNAILGFSDLLSKGLAGAIANEAQREYIGLINQSGHHLLELVTSILDLSKLENGTYELEADEFLPDEAAAFAISLLGVQARDKHVGLNYLPLCGLDTFYGDKRVIQQIIINLLSNAVKFTPKHGHIGLRVALDDERLMITVEDTGIGMSKDELAKVGTPFYQASSNHTRLHEGAGLGLSLVRQLAVLHGGALEISSEPGKGTRVRVALAILGRQATVVAYPQQKYSDESVRLIQIDEERNYGQHRKTA